MSVAGPSAGKAIETYCRMRSTVTKIAAGQARRPSDLRRPVQAMAATASMPSSRIISGIG